MSAAMTDDEMAETIMRELPAAYEIMPPDILCGYISVYRNDKRRKETTLVYEMPSTVAGSR